ncbi:glycosyltransferase family 2 protein [Salinisphaera shabanensis]|nr:glycosyltransferase [Salinisphaera shabanensis]
MRTASNDCPHATGAPRVTVLIAAFQAGRYIDEAIESVLAQTFHDFELLIIDDASTDDTSNRVCAHTGDPRVCAITHIRNIGRAASRNHGIDLARGEYIAFLDADDRCESSRLEQQLAYLDSHPEITGVGSWMALIDEQGNRLDDQIYSLPLEPDHVACRMLFECSLAQPAMMVRRYALSSYRYDTDIALAEDYELWARMITTCRFANLAEPLTCYRRHAEQVSVNQLHAQQHVDFDIYGRQLARLGITYDQQDLIRHECVFKRYGRKPVLEHTGAPLDIHYLRWCNAWLSELRAANAQYRIYPEPALSDMLVSCWIFACRKAARNSGWLRVAAEFMRSELRSAIVPFMKRHMKTRLRVRGGLARPD